MIKPKLILGALIAGCLSLGSAMAQDRPILTDEQKAMMEEIRAKMEEGRGAFKGMHDSLCTATKEEIAKRIAEQKAAFDALRKAHEADIAAHKAEWEKRMAERKAEIEARLKEIEAKRAEWIKNHPDAGARLSPEKLAELKERFEKLLKDGALGGV